MQVDTRHLRPWAPISRMVNNMRSLTVMVGNKEYSGDAEITTENGHVTIAFPAPKKAPKRESVGA